MRRTGPVTSAHDAPYELVKTMRASVLVLGPLLARYGTRAFRSPAAAPSACAPSTSTSPACAPSAPRSTRARRRGGTARRLAGTRFRFSLPTVGGTENLLMAAATARGTTMLENCAREPEIADLAALLNAMGARIHGAGDATVEIEGVDALGAAVHPSSPTASRPAPT